MSSARMSARGGQQQQPWYYDDLDDSGDDKDDEVNKTLILFQKSVRMEILLKTRLENYWGGKLLGGVPQYPIPGIGGGYPNTPICRQGG